MKTFIPKVFGPWAAFYKTTDGKRSAFGIKLLSRDLDYGVTGAAFGYGFVLAYRKNLDKTVHKHIDWNARKARRPLPEKYRQMLFPPR